MAEADDSILYDEEALWKISRLMNKKGKVFQFIEIMWLRRGKRTPIEFSDAELAAAVGVSVSTVKRMRSKVAGTPLMVVMPGRDGRTAYLPLVERVDADGRPFYEDDEAA